MTEKTKSFRVTDREYGHAGRAWKYPKGLGFLETAEFFRATGISFSLHVYPGGAFDVEPAGDLIEPGDWLVALDKYQDESCSYQSKRDLLRGWKKAKK